MGRSSSQDAVNIRNPDFRPDPVDLGVLQARFFERFGGAAPRIGVHKIKGVTDRIAERACEAVLLQLSPAHTWINANSLRTNNPGFDYLIDGRTRIQVKGSSHVEQPGWHHKPDPRHKSLEFDLLFLVDVGVCLETNAGRFAKYRWRRNDTVDYYIVPNAIVREWVRNPRYPNSGRLEIYWNRRPFGPSTKQHLGQTMEIQTYKDRFDLLAAAIARPTRQAAD